MLPNDNFDSVSTLKGLADSASFEHFFFFFAHRWQGERNDDQRLPLLLLKSRKEKGTWRDALNRNKESTTAEEKATMS